MKRSLKRYRCALPKEETDEVEEPDEITQIKNSVYFYAEVSRTNNIKLIQKITDATDHVLKNCDDIFQAKIYLYINSIGGDAFCGFSVMDHIRCNRIPVVTVADGYVASAATFLLLAGAERKIMRNTKILIHQLSTAFWGKYTDLLDEVENSKEIMSSIRKIYVQSTNLSQAKLDVLLKKELHLNATQAKALGFVDEIW